MEIVGQILLIILAPVIIALGLGASRGDFTKKHHEIRPVQTNIQEIKPVPPVTAGKMAGERRADNPQTP